MTQYQSNHKVKKCTFAVSTTYCQKQAHGGVEHPAHAVIRWQPAAKEKRTKGELFVVPSKGTASKNENPKLGHSGLKMHPTCGVNTTCMCKISRGGKRKKKEGRGKEKDKKKEERRREDRRRKKGGESKKKEERRRKEERRKNGSAGNGSEPYWSWWTKLGLLPSSVSVLISDSRASVPGTPAEQRDSLQAWNVRGLLCLRRYT